ncbi:hypothetical protein KSZ_74990 [Dictyobacter formicarum]|uniref:Uncharacterized protein n=1 Tax=Dictyobacter formicarum TaxID=2778368 RepID=A0ABQ3VVU1_9CHLR|nr:hypothetical protein KSZ_74990 [Dictyobacter formicarum]
MAAVILLERSPGTLTTEEWKAEQQLEQQYNAPVPVNSVPTQFPCAGDHRICETCQCYVTWP